jgi:hypothetical protein
MAVRLSALWADRYLTPQKHNISVSGNDICYRQNTLAGLLRPEGLGKLIKIIPPTKGVSTLLWWWGLRDSVTWRAMPAVV